MLCIHVPTYPRQDEVSIDFSSVLPSLYSDIGHYSYINWYQITAYFEYVIWNSVVLTFTLISKALMSLILTDIHALEVKVICIVNIVAA